MKILLDYKDTITIKNYEVDGYGEPKITTSVDVKALFVQKTGYSEANHQASIVSHSSVYVDINNQFIKDNWNVLEGMFVVASPLGGEYSQSWYKIVDVEIGQDKLLTNSIDTIQLQLKKTTEALSVI